MFRNGVMAVVVRFVTVSTINLALAIGTILAIADQNGLNTRPVSKVIPLVQGDRPPASSAKAANYSVVIYVNLGSSLAKPCTTVPSTIRSAVVVSLQVLAVCI